MADIDKALPNEVRKEFEVPVYKFLKDPLIKRFGKEWYEEVEKVGDV